MYWKFVWLALLINYWFSVKLFFCAASWFCMYLIGILCCCCIFTIQHKLHVPGRCMNLWIQYILEIYIKSMQKSIFCIGWHCSAVILKHLCTVALGCFVQCSDIWLGGICPLENPHDFPPPKVLLHKKWRNIYNKTLRFP